mgnify:CR=1 FL=1
MLIHFKMLLAGVGMIGAGVMVTAMGCDSEPYFRSGLWQGPLAILGGGVVVYMSIRRLFRNDEDE